MSMDGIRWSPTPDVRVQQQLAELNLACLDMLVEQANPLSPMPLLRDLAPEWRGLDAAARRQLAASPYLLVDAGFTDEARWNRLQFTGVHDLPRSMRSLCFPVGQVVSYARRVLVLAWHLAQAQPALARILLGATEPCLQRIAALGLADIDRLCERHPWWVRPRWELQPELWRHLLQAARDSQAGALQQATLRGVQMMAAALLPPEGGRRGAAWR
jgi:hypothetical protein